MRISTVLKIAAIIVQVVQSQNKKAPPCAAVCFANGASTGRSFNCNANQTDEQCICSMPTLLQGVLSCVSGRCNFVDQAVAISICAPDPRYSGTTQWTIRTPSMTTQSFTSSPSPRYTYSWETEPVTNPVLLRGGVFGLGFGAFLGFSVLCLIVYLLMRRRSRSKAHGAVESGPAELDPATTTAKELDGNNTIAELEAKKYDYASQWDWGQHKTKRSEL